MRPLCRVPLVLWLVLNSAAWAQDAPTVEPTQFTEATATAAEPPALPDAPAGTAVPPQEQPAAGAPPDAASAEREEHVIYVPYSKLLDVFEDEDSSIVLPYAQFLEMWNRLTQKEPQAAAPPIHGVITRAQYTGAVAGDLARLTATLDVDVLTAEWAQLPVEFGDAAIGSAESEDGSVLLRGVEQGRYELLVRGRGRHRITLTLAVGVKSTPEGKSFSVQCPMVGVTNLELQIPEKDLAVQVTPRRTSETRTEGDDTTRVTAALGSTKEFSVSWQPKSGRADEATALAHVTDTIAVEIGEGVVHTHAIFEYRILRGSLSELLFEIPVGQRLLDVQVPGLRDWQSEPLDDRQRVRVRLHAPVTEGIRLEFHTEDAIAEAAFRVGQVRAVGVARESGILAVRGGEDVRLEFVERELITRVDAAEVPESLRKPGSSFYKFFTPDHKVSVVVSEMEPHIVVDSHIAILLNKTRLTTRSEFRYQISRTGIFALTYRLPNGFQVDDVRTDSMERFDVAAGDDAQVLTIYFTQRMLGDLTVGVTASQTRDAAAGQLTIPLPEPLNTTRERGLVAVLAPESLELKTDLAELQAARAATPAELAAQGFQPEVPPGSTLAAAFSFVTRPVRILQTVTERPRRMTVAVATVAHVREDIVQVTTTLRYQVQFAGTDAFRIAVPASVSDRLQFEGESVRERRRSDQAREDGTVEWTIVLHSEVLGEYTFTVTYDQKISMLDEGAQWELQPIQTLDADRESGEIAIQKDRALSVAATPHGLEEIDPRELSQTIGTTQPYLAYRYFEQPTRLTLNVTKHELQDVVETIVSRAYIEAVVTHDGPVTVRARYELKSSERQRLAMTLRDPRILGMTVAGQSVAPEKAPTAPGGGAEDKTYLINVARAGGADEPFQIVTVFETPLPDSTLGITDLLTLALPQFDEGVKFQQVYVRLWVPKDYRLVGDPEGFTSHVRVGLWDSRQIIHAPDNPDNWFPKDTSSFDFQVGGTTYLFSSLSAPTQLTVEYWHIPTMTTIASLLVLVVGGVLLRFSLDTKVLAILAAVLVMAFAALFWPSIVHSWLLAARLGLAGLVALWLVTWLLQVHRKGYALSFLSGSTGARPGEVVASDTNTADATDQQATSSSLPPVAEVTPTPTGTGTVDEDFVISDSSSSPFAPPDEPSADRPPESSDEQRERGRDDQ